MLTTGANSGIGLATVLAVARAGYRSVGTVRSEAKADVVAEAAADAGVEVATVILDVTDAERGAEVIDQVRPWGLVNNAGYGLTGAIEDVDDDEARALFEALVIAPMRLCRLALPHMRARNEGRIVNVSSMLGVTTAPLVGWYSGVKHALEALTDALRVEVASAGVRVSLVEPGGVKTEIWQDLEGDLERRGATAYAGAYRRSHAGVRFIRPFMADPAGVADVIVRAMTTRLPRERYLVGIDAMATTAASRLTPQTIWDLASRLGLGL